MVKEYNNNFLEVLFSVIALRDKSKGNNSYTKTLLKQGKKKIAQKISVKVSSKKFSLFLKLK